MKTKRTQITQRREDMQHSKDAVMSITGMNLLEYNTFLFDVGVALVENHIEPSKLKELIRIPEYWSWFRNEFFMYEKDLFRQMKLYGPDFNQSNIEALKYLYQREMSYMIEERSVAISLNHFIKRFK